MSTEAFSQAKEYVSRLTDSAKTPLIVAIDGRCGSGKSTLGAQLAGYFDANLFHMDDFYLRLEQRTQERYEEPGGNVDYERFMEEVLKPVLAGETVQYRRIDCRDFSVEKQAREIAPKRLNIVEGSYSLHPSFGRYYDLAFFMTIDSKVQLERILARNGEEKLNQFISRWIPLEEKYFAAFSIPEKAVVLCGDTEGKL